MNYQLEISPEAQREIKAGRWRVVYQIIDDLVLVSVIRVRRKEDIDYDTV